MSEPTRPEFSYSIDCGRLGAHAQTVELSAGAAERAALAERLDLLAVDRLEASLRVAREPGRMIRIDGRLRASVTQACAVTLDPVPAEIDEEVDILYTEDPVEAVPEPDPSIDLEETLWPEPVEDGRIDVGEAMAQQLALALDPYPRAPGAEVDPAFRRNAPAEEGETHRPFSDLAQKMGSGSGR